MPRFFIQFCILSSFLLGLQRHASGSQWQALSDTPRFKVAYDEQSIHQTPLGRLGICIRFLPKGEAGRKMAAAEYKEKRYRSHVEYYEIDCITQSAALNLTDIFGSKRVRLKQLHGDAQLDPILPGSVLENVMQRFCPVLAENPDEENEAGEAVQAEKADTTDGSALSHEKLQLIEKLQKKVASKEATFETWKELGNIYFDTDQAEQAIQAYAEALVLQPDDTDILNDQGAMYRQTGEYQRAVANFEKAFSLAPDNLESLYNSGYVYAFDLKNIPQALVVWRRYMTLDSKSESARQVQSFIDQYGK